MTEPDKPEQSPSAPPPPPPPPPNPAQQQPYPPQQPYQYGAYPGSYPPPPQGPYGGYPAQTAPKNGLGIASLVVAIVGLLSVFGGILLGIVAVILGFLGRGRAKRGEATNGGVAMAGIILGFLGIVVGVVAIALTVVFAREVGAGDLFECLQQAGNDTEAQQQCQDQFQRKLEDQFSVTVTPSP
ncbi:hypothetical protein NIIDNTM18_29640 [Mycolicibacterium litorale]|uniref:DUF4190 domain-containing protein n=1 Tax=Mycolicibacterium litorale TaxID=758802 RepID=A0A6S6P6K2_9MYCO|nr:DUF4190 domain-containing protein [Mycolicibacterium litorale]BCI53686.1 hypothetical protein NIIDNTM18_29640 [Mycolicibacterium litorale]